MVSRRGITLSGVLGLVIFGMALVSPAAQAAHVTCGSVITSSTTLDSDVGPCTPALGGIRITASNVTLNLGGKRILGRPDLTGEGPGIRIVGASNVTIQGPGEIRDFDAGIAKVGPGNNIKVVDVRVIDNIGTGETDFGDGIVIFGGSGHQILRNQAIHNGPYDGIAIVGNVQNSLIEGNLVQGNNVPFILREGRHGPMQDTGIRLEHIPGSQPPIAPRFNTVQNNTVQGSGLDGISILPSASDNIVQRNAVSQNGFHNEPFGRKGSGIRVGVEALRNQVLDNRVSQNALDGIALVNARFTKVLRNVSQGNGAAGTGGFDGFDAIFEPPCDNNTWLGNSLNTVNQPCVLNNSPSP